MPSTVQVNAGWFAMLTISAIFVILYPLVLALITQRRLKVGWRYFGYGALIFFVFQLITRVPAILVLQQTVLAPPLPDSATFRWTWLIVLVLTAGLFEEVGRYVGYRVLMRKEEKTWSKAVMYGLGHGGLESMLLVGGSLLLTIINIATLSATNLNVLPAAQHALVVKQFAQLNAQPIWFPLLGVWERFWTIPLHVGLSVLVLQVFRRGNLNWLWLAILLHALTDFVGAGLLPMLLGSGIWMSLLQEGFVALAGVLGVWMIWRLRERPLAEVPAEPSAGEAAPEATL